MAGKKISQLSSSIAPSLTGFTAVVDGGVTYKSSLQTLRNVLVDSGSHVFTGDQIIKGDLTVSGSITAEEYILSSSITNIVLETISGSSHFGNDLNDVHNFTGSVYITGSLNVDHLGTVTQMVVGTQPFEELGTEALHVGSLNDINIAHFEGDNNIYTQINLRNRSSSSLASSDIVATADNGDEFVHYVDLGINSSTYEGGFVGLANDSYLLNVGKDMYIGTVGGPDGPASLKLFAENSWENPQITISGSNLISFNTGSVSEGFEFEFSGSAKFDHNVDIVSGTTTMKESLIGFGEFHTSSFDRESLRAGTSGSINIAHFEGNHFSYSQINLKNTNSGSSASGDIVVTADNGTENVHYVDLGINSSTYDAGFVGYENDAYLVNVGKDMYIGTVGGENNPDTKLHLFAQNNWEDAPVIISGSNQISFNTGSVTNGFMYEFSGSAKFDNNVIVDGTTVFGGNLIPKEASGATLGTANMPFADIYIQSASIHIQSDTPGEPDTTLSNVGGNIQISAGGMQLLGTGSFNAVTASFGYLSGSFTHIGSQFNEGNTVTTGSLQVSGSSIQIGDNTLIGNTLLSGSIGISGSVYINGNRQFNYGQFFDTTTQSGSANVAHVITINSINVSSGVNMVSGSQLKVENDGLYNLQFSAQLLQTTNGSSDISIWLRKNGNNIPSSSTDITIEKTSGGGKSVAAWNFMLDLNANDYIELVWSSNSANTQIYHIAPQINPIRPETPSIIVTLTQII